MARRKVAIPDFKKCNMCNLIKPNNEFYKTKSRRDGLDVWCKKCKIEYNKTIRDTLYASNKEFCKKLKDRKDNEIKYPRKKKCYKCGEIKKKGEFHKCRSRTSGLSDLCVDCTKKSRIEKRQQRNQYQRNRRESDPEYKMYCSLQKRVHGALNSQGLKKYKRTMALVGCTSLDFIIYIESLWDNKMSWDNYGKGIGKWSLDHIRPCASFNLLDEAEQMKCFSYKNTRPLWNTENYSKNSWYNGKKYSNKDRNE